MPAKAPPKRKQLSKSKRRFLNNTGLKTTASNESVALKPKSQLKKQEWELVKGGKGGAKKVLPNGQTRTVGFPVRKVKKGRVYMAGSSTKKRR